MQRREFLKRVGIGTTLTLAPRFDRPLLPSEEIVDPKFISQDFVIHRTMNILYQGSGRCYWYHDFYNWLQDTFDETKWMEYPIPIVASHERIGKTDLFQTKYVICNGWNINQEASAHLYTRKYDVEEIR